MQVQFERYKYSYIYLENGVEKKIIVVPIHHYFRC